MTGGGVAVVGTGLIGASIGLASRTAGFVVRGWDADASTAGHALANGSLDERAPTLDDLLERLGPGDVLALATPLEATLALLSAPNLRAATPGLILDTASVKAAVTAAGAGLDRFVPSHPIAGSERSGPMAADASLFRGRVWTLEATAEAPARAAAADFVRKLGARPLEIAAADHDRILAFTSHLPQVVAVALAAELAERRADARIDLLCGTGMQSMTRLGASAWSMWRGVLAENSKPVAQELRNFAAILATFADEVEADDAVSIERRFRRSAAGVERDGT